LARRRARETALGAAEEKGRDNGVGGCRVG
jgi:hypothetical protein